MMADLLSEDLVKRNMLEEWIEDLEKGLKYTNIKNLGYPEETCQKFF